MVLTVSDDLGETCEVGHAQLALDGAVHNRTAAGDGLDELVEVQRLVVGHCTQSFEEAKHDSQTRVV